VRVEERSWFFSRRRDYFCCKRIPPTIAIIDGSCPPRPSRCSSNDQFSLVKVVVTAVSAIAVAIAVAIADAIADDDAVVATRTRTIGQR
jgi:hypothetical protein